MGNEIETFVYEGVEVTKTGRKAKREIVRPRGEPVVTYLHEITPTDGTGWLKWVKLEELFLIEE